MNAFSLVANLELFSSIPRLQLRAYAKSWSVRILERNDILVRTGSPQDAIVCLAEGRLSISATNKRRGVTLLLGVVDAPSILGDAEWASGVPWMATLKAEEPSACALIPNQQFAKLVQAHPPVCYALYRDASLRHLLANHTAQTVALYDIDTRLLRLILDYAHRYGTLDGDRLRVKKSLSKAHMALALGVTTKTIQRTVASLEEGGWISQGEGRVWYVHKLTELQAELPPRLLGLVSKYGEAVASVNQRIEKMK